MLRNWITAVVLVVISGTSFVPYVRANEEDKKTLLTFSKPIEIPGATLPAGTYVFKLLGSQSNRNVVLIYDADETHFITSVSGIYTTRLERTGETVIVFDYKSADGTPLLKKWFYPGDGTGLEFVYSHQQLDLAKATAASSLSRAD